MSDASSATHAEQFQALIRSRTTVHDFTDHALPPGALQRALEAGLTAPNHRMTEPWRFVRVGTQSRERLAEIQARLKDKTDTPSAEAVQRARAKIMASAELVVVGRAIHKDPGVGREDYAAIACAVQNIGLSLWAEGIGSKWSTGGVTTDGETYRCLGLSPTEVEIVGFLWVGYAAPQVNTKKPPRRLSVSQVLTEVP